MNNEKCLEQAHKMLLEIDDLDYDSFDKADEALEFCVSMNEAYNSQGETDPFIRELLLNNFVVNYIDYKEKAGYEDWMDEYTGNAQLLYDCFSLISTTQEIGKIIASNL